MAQYLGIDTSNYTTSVAVYDSKTDAVIQSKRLLPVKAGGKGLKQSDAVFLHTKQIADVFKEVAIDKDKIAAIGVSCRPRDVDGSYMPCFLVGQALAEVLAQTLDVPVYGFSHQAGHIAAGLYSAGRMELTGQAFLAFHLSGGTTEALMVNPGQDTPFNIRCVASSLDLKAGQAVDRVGVMLGISFPAGKELEQLAEASRREFHIRVPMKGADCCLSGVENQCQRMLAASEPGEDIAKYCLTYILTVLERMTEALQETYGSLPLLYVGGVMSNRRIRERMTERFDASFAAPAFSADNAAGTAILTYLKAEKR
ncbi:peptidase M22 [Candidatus Soleaferrea massiliensis]|uniref:peptidase M22 n=1 Tax=Candidatus Soleaferrea massiliensis TaxID=1470354 RepID=UPI00058D546D|nr:peptidase M22 [Candidatus Soleaferrea massiliensis]